MQSDNKHINDRNDGCSASIYFVVRDDQCGTGAHIHAWRAGK